MRYGATPPVPLAVPPPSATVSTYASPQSRVSKRVQSSPALKWEAGGGKEAVVGPAGGLAGDGWGLGG